jgi:hypothetical protein
VALLAGGITGRGRALKCGRELGKLRRREFVLGGGRGGAAASRCIRRPGAEWSGLAGGSGLAAAAHGGRQLASHRVEEAAATTAQNSSLATAEEAGERRGALRGGRITLRLRRRSRRGGSLGRCRSRRCVVAITLALGRCRGTLGEGVLAVAFLPVEENTDLAID